MNIVIIPTRSMFDSALEAARIQGQRELVTLGDGLTADLFASLRGRIEDAWENVVRILNQAFIKAREETHAALADASSAIREIIATAGTEAVALQAQLLDRMRTFVNDYTQKLLTLVPSYVVVGGLPLSLAKATISQRIKLGGSVEANLTKLCDFVSEGEMEIACDYEAPR